MYSDEQIEKCYYNLDRKELIPDFKAYNKEFKNIISDVNNKITKIVPIYSIIEKEQDSIIIRLPGSG